MKIRLLILLSSLRVLLLIYHLQCRSVTSCSYREGSSCATTSGVILVWLSHGMPVSYWGYPEGNRFSYGYPEGNRFSYGYPEGNRFSYGYPVLADKLLPAYPLVSVCGNLEYLCVTVLIKVSIQCCFQKANRHVLLSRVTYCAILLAGVSRKVSLCCGYPELILYGYPTGSQSLSSAIQKMGSKLANLKLSSCGYPAGRHLYVYAYSRRL